MEGTDETGGTRERIVAVALDLFSHQGYAGTSIRDIADRMGMTKAAVYYHFPSKENLLANVLTPALTRVGAVLAGAGDTRTPEDRRRLVTDLIDVVGDVGPQVVVMLSDPTVGTHLRAIAGETSLPDQVGAALIGPMPADPRAAAAARIRAACAIGCLPAGVEAWSRDNPGRTRLDDEAKAVLVRTVLAVVETPA
jgi:AcrR family transcriptional regulator